MGIKAKALGNILANRQRGFENKQNQMEDPANMPAPPAPDENMPVVDETAMPEEGKFTVPSESLQGVMPGDTLVVESDDGMNVTLTKEPAMPEESATPPMPEMPM